MEQVPGCDGSRDLGVVGQGQSRTRGNRTMAGAAARNDHGLNVRGKRNRSSVTYTACPVKVLVIVVVTRGYKQTSDQEGP